MSTATYYAFPQALDFGNIAFGDTSKYQTAKIEYILSPTSAGAGVGIGANVGTQQNVLNDTFYIDDRGSGAKNIVTISNNGTTGPFTNTQTLSQFLAADPPYYISLTVNISPVLGKTSTTGDFVVYLTSTQVPSFQIPIHFRIVNGLYVTPQDVRDSMGPLGTQRVTKFTLQDSFTNSSLPLWTKDTGSFTVDVNGTGYATDSPSSADQAWYTNFPDLGDYSVGAYMSLASAGTAGLIVARSGVGNYFRCIVSSQTGNAEIDQVVGGYATALTTVSVGTVTLTQYRLKVDKHPGSIVFYVNDVPTLQYNGTISTGPSGVTATSAGGGVQTTALFNEYQVSTDEYQFPDSVILSTIAEEQSFIEQRTRRIYGTQTVTELLDWNEQDVQRLPYIFNRLGSDLFGFSSVPTSSLTSPQLNSTYSKSLWLRYKPVMSVISLEEDQSPDGSNPSWILYTQGRSGDYVAYPDLGRIIFTGTTLPRNGRQNLRVIYSVGTAGVPPYIQGYVKESVALRLLENIGVGNDAIAQIVAKKKERLVRYEEFIPQWTGMYAVGSGQRKT
jgi:hypothetical protein